MSHTYNVSYLHRARVTGRKSSLPLVDAAICRLIREADENNRNPMNL